MNKRIIISLSVIGAVAAIAVGGTIAYFSDTETSTGNTFTAGSLDLQIDSTCHYYQNGVEVPCEDASGASFGTWELTDLKDGVHKFFAFNDVKPGDYGEDTISLHVYDNPAWACVQLGPLTNNDNDCNEPELEAEEDAYEEGNETCDNPGEGEGELGDNLNFTIWADYNCNNVWDEVDGVREPILTSGPANGDPLNGVVWPIADSQSPNIFTGIIEPIMNSTTYCIGVGWSVPSNVGNIIQSDSVSGDISFYVEQARNNAGFVCGQY